jgi:hypothetical protein
VQAGKGNGCNGIETAMSGAKSTKLQTNKTKIIKIKINNK